MGRAATDKKERLVDAAMRRFHRHGVASASLAAVANDASVPPGNVYYYFRSKDALTAAVIDRWCERAGDHLASFDAITDPLEAIRRFLGSASSNRQSYAEFGCPLAALGSDLRHESPMLASGSVRPLILVRDWLEGKFAAGLGSPCAAQRAEFCLSTLQGSFTLARSTADAGIIARTVDQLLGWVDDLARSARET